jgi:uncharacterized membrane protein YfcA
LVILATAFCVYTVQETMTAEIWWLALICAPAKILGAFLGLCTHARVNDQQFRKLVPWLLLASGVVLTVSNLT